MKRSKITLTLSLIFFAFVLAANHTTYAQTSVTLANDAATEGSDPYNEAVRRYLNNERPKIIGGKQAPDAAFPWQVSLGVAFIADPLSAHFCGGSVYSERWIVTAAHCVERLTPAKVIVSAGTNRLVPGTTRANVKLIIVKKNYDRNTHDNDIALIELLNPLPLSFQIKPVSLLTPAEDTGRLIEGASFVVTGWGATQEGGQTVRDLRYLDELPLVLRSVCNEPFSYDGKITENMICAGVLAGGKDSCQGDSGSGLTIDASSAPKLAGIVSWGEGCARPNRVGIYTRVANYADWVNQCVSNSLTCNQ